MRRKAILFDDSALPFEVGVVRHPGHKCRSPLGRFLAALVTVGALMLMSNVVQPAYAQMEPPYQGVRALAETRDRLQANPDSAEVSAVYANEAILLFQRTGDSRYTGYARHALQKWVDMTQPPKAIWLLRARLAQTEHQFETAARDLEQFLKRYPEVTEAQLLAADAWRRTGHITNSRQSCIRLALGGHSALAKFCGAEILMSLGQHHEALTLALATLDEFDVQTGAVQKGTVYQWGLTVGADAARAAGDLELALSLLSRVVENKKLVLPDLPASVLAASTRLTMADLYISLARTDLASMVLAPLALTEGKLLRLAKIDQHDAAGKPPAPGNTRAPDLESAIALQQRFDLDDQLDTDNLHDFERASFYLHVQNDARNALIFARRNWVAQKNWEDAELLLQAAQAAKSQTDIDQIHNWRQQWK